MKSKFYKKASFTIEATFVVPLILILIIFVMWYGFWLHDYIVVKAYSAVMAEDGRMAMNYGKVPGDNKIMANGYGNDELRDKAEKKIAENYKGLSESVMAGMITTPNVSLEKDYTRASINYSPISFRYYRSGQFLKSRNIYSSFDGQDAGMIARITTLVYRLLKILVNKGK